MAREYTNHQKKIISRYYENRDQIDEQRLSELATELYLSQGKKRQNLWKRAEELMTRFKVPAARIRHVVESDDPAVLVAVVEDLQKGRFK